MRAMAWISVSMSWLLAWSAPAAESLDPALWVARVPKLGLEEKGVTNFSFRGVLAPEQFKLAFAVTARQTSDVSMTVYDPRDGTPIIVGRGKRLLIYDPMSAEVMLATAWPGLKLELVPPPPGSAPDAQSRLNVWFGFNTVASNSVTVADLKGLLGHASAKYELRPSGADGALSLAGFTKDDSRIVFRIEPGRADGPFAQMEVYSKEQGDKPFLRVDDIRVNTSLEDDVFRFPEEAVKASGLSIRELKADGFFGCMMDMGRIGKALMVRFGLSSLDAKERDALARKLMLGTVDWNGVRQRDAAMSQALRRIFPLER